MLIGCDLFSSSLEFQKLTNSDLFRLKKKFKNIKILKINPNIKNNKAYKEIQVYWGNRINIDILKKMKNLKWIHYGSTGTNEEIINYSKIKNIKVSNTKKLFDNSVAATALGFIFCLSRGIQYSLYSRGTENHKRNFYNKIYYKMNDVFEKKILFVGYGNIAKKIAKVCRSMGMEIFIVKRKFNKNLKNTHSLKNLNKAVKNKDFVINLLPSSKDTKEIFNFKVFKNMDRSSFFLNLGRGETVNENDLERIIKDNFISGVGLDVVQNEPFEKNFSLLKYDNVIITPHIAGINTKYKIDQVNLFMNNFSKFLNNKKLRFSL